MPTYAYRCKDCGHAFDIVQKFSEDSLTVCPECEGALRKKFGSVGVSFKGSGFYRTDSRGGTTASDGAKSSSDGTKASSGTASSGGSGAASTSGSGSGD